MIPRLVLVLLPFLALSACREEHEWHQKTTVTVATPAGEVSGATVVGVRALFGQLPMSGTEVQYGFTGEATVVEVAPGRYLFALLGGSEERFYRAARDRFKGKTRGEWLYDIPKQTEPVTLTGDRVPLLVTFADITDPTTVTRVDPANLAASFGPGVSLMAVTLAVTEDPVTVGRVEALLGCIRSHTSCVPLNLTLPYGHPMRNVPNNEFMRTIE